MYKKVIVLFVVYTIALIVIFNIVSKNNMSNDVKSPEETTQTIQSPQSLKTNMPEADETYILKRNNAILKLENEQLRTQLWALGGSQGEMPISALDNPEINLDELYANILKDEAGISD